MESVLDPSHREGHHLPGGEPRHSHHDHHNAEPFTIHVNNKPVRLTSHHQTGLQIKEAAIAQGVKIQLDFVLSEELPDGRTRVIGDNDRVEVNAHTRFEAIPNDDHS